MIELQSRPNIALSRPPTSGAAGVVDVLRRVIDLTVGVVLVVATLPLVVVGAVGSAICLRAWPVFTQRRIGRDGRPFTVLKIRTLPVEHPPYATKYELPTTGIPRFTRALRDLHIDELPQLLLVVTGRMSLVGPRPEMAVLHDALPDEVAAERTTVKPGCTGLWQLSPRSRMLICESPEYDHFYVTNRTFRLDLWIVVETVAVLVRRRKTLTLASVPDWTTRPLRTERRRSVAIGPAGD